MIDPTRHRAVFSPDLFGERRVDVVGVGATGSRIALSLAKLGVENLHVWDFDRVEEHNLANQMYGMEDIGLPKVDAAARLIRAQTGDDITVHNEAVDENTPLGDVVFLLTDTMASRRAIFKGLALKFRTRLVIETRMGVDEGRVYAFDPNNPLINRRWESTLYDDDDATVEASMCGTAITVGPTAELVSGFAVWQFIKWAQVELTHEGDAPDFEMIFGGRYPTAMVF